MRSKYSHEDIDRFLEEADELIHKIDSQSFKGVHAGDRAQFENHAQNLKELRSNVRKRIDTDGRSDSGTYSEGMHKPIDEIVRAIKNLASCLT